MTEKETLQKQAKDLGIDTQGLTIAELNTAIAGVQTEEASNKEVDAEQVPSAPKDQEEEVVETTAEEGYDLSFLKKAENVRVFIDFTNGKCGEEKVVALLDKVNRK
jgi:hypothetical protein